MSLNQKINRPNSLGPKELLEEEAKNRLGSMGASGPYAGADSSFELAFRDIDLLARRETRGIRFQLELLKPDLIQTEEGINHTIVVFGGARFKSMEEAQKFAAEAKTPFEIDSAATEIKSAAWYEAARAFGRLASEECAKLPLDERLFICTGGGPGIMEAANRGASEAGAKTVGLNIALPKEQQPNPYITPRLCFDFHYFALRKMHFMMRAKALLAFPGGFGTLDELFEVLTLIQTRKSERVPVILFDSAFWKKLVNWETLAEIRVINPSDLELFSFADTPQDAWEAIRQFYWG